MLSVLCTGVFIWSGSHKLVAPEHLAYSLTELGAPSRFTTTGAVRALAGGEIVLGLVLLAWPRSGFPLAVLLAFSLGLAVVAIQALRIGAEAPCGCFGSTSDAPLGRATLANAGAFFAAAVVSLLQPTSGPGLSVDQRVALAAVTALSLSFWVERDVIYGLLFEGRRRGSTA